MSERPVTSVFSVLATAFLLLTASAAQAQNLSISDVTQAETNGGTTTFTFTVSLDAPAAPGGVTFDIATADDTATTADNDYVAQSLTGQAIAAGNTTYFFNVTVNGDVIVEPGQTFFVNVTNVTGATVADGQGLGTISNDDGPITLIHDVQGNGASSPIVGSVVNIRGIVTGVKSNGFFVQEEDVDVDADPNTSEGIFVFTSGAPPAAAAFTALVEVTGTVSEFVPISDPLDPPSTRLISPSVVQIAAPGQTLPTSTLLSGTFPDPAGPFDQLERVEHMRVSAASITVSGPSTGSLNEADATGTSDGRFHGVITGVARPFREAGVQAPDPVPSGSIPPIPRWDSNPERIRIESAAINSQPIITVKSGDVVAPLTGPLDYSARGYALLPDGTTTSNVTPGTLTTTVTSATGNEVTVASVNLRRFFDTTDDAGSDTVLTPTAYTTRLAKASIAIRTHLRNPDIIGVQEAEKLDVLNDLAARILSDGGPGYDAYLSEGNDAAGLDVGFLVKTDLVSGGVPRVSNVVITQVGLLTTWTDPVDNQQAILHDRPPLVLEATVYRAPTVSFPIVVIVADHLGLTGINSEEADGLTTVGDRVRKKRLVQAQELANYIQMRQTDVPGEHIAVIGSFNAFESNDGYADVMNTLTGTPPPDNQTVVPGDGLDLVNPDLVNLFATPPPAERYSDVFEGNARNVDHVLVSTGLIADTAARRIEHPRIAADYPETEVGDDATALRFSDRDPVVAYFSVPLNTLGLADLQVTKVDTPDPVTAGQNLTYTITATNNGPDPGDMAFLTDTLQPGATFVSLSSPGGWSCTTPAVGAGGTITCDTASMSVGSAVFTLTVAVSPSVAEGTELENTATVSSLTGDPNSGNDSTTATTTVATAANLSTLVVDAPDPVNAGQNITYTVTATNTGPSDASTVTVTNPVTGNATFVSASVVTGSGWTIAAPAVGSTGNVVFSKASVASTETATFSIVVTIGASTPGGTIHANTATIASATTDPSPGNNISSATTLVNGAPTITAITNQTIDEDSATTALPFTIGDAETAPATLTVSATSSNQTLVPDANIVFGGTGANRTITVTPLIDQSGQTTITVTVSDGTASASTSFVLTVTPSPTALTWFLAEGATGTFFDEDLMIANPNTSDAPVTVTFFREGMTNVTETRTIPARSGVTLRVDSLPGLEAAAASVQVSSDNNLPLAVERTQFWGEGSYGGHTESALPAPATQWYFAEGSQGYFDTFVLVANPQATPVDVTLTFLREGDTTTTTTVQVPAFSRKTVSAATIPELVNRSFGIIVNAAQPVVAERAMYFGTTAARPWSGGAAAAGATAPSSTWYFAEGATGTFFDTFFLLMNPDVVDAQVTVRYLLDTGETIDVPKVVPARGRLTINIETESDTRLHTGSMSAFITSDRGIVAERSVYWPTAEGAQPWGESHVSQGVTAAASRWALAEGRTGGALNFHTYILLGNPRTQPAEVTVEFLPDSGAPVLKTYVVPAMSRFTIDATTEAPTIQDRSFITLITTAFNTPIVVERSLYWDGLGLMWSGGSNAVGVPLP